jgi:hypothetical protein
VARRSHAPRGSSIGQLTLVDDEGEDVVILRARAEGTWANRLSVRVTQVKGAAGGVKYVNLNVLYDGASTPIETFSRLVMDEESPDYLFTRINQGSAVLVATDPAFDAGLPAARPAQAFDAASEAVAASVQLKSGAEDVCLVRAKRPGRAGNQSVVRVRNAASGLLLKDGDGNASVDVRVRQGVDKPLSVSVRAPAADGKSTLTIFKDGAAPRPVVFESVDTLVDTLKTDPDLQGNKQGAGKPARFRRRSRGGSTSRSRPKAASRASTPTSPNRRPSNRSMIRSSNSTTRPSFRTRTAIRCAAAATKVRRCCSPATSRPSRCSSSFRRTIRPRTSRWRSSVPPAAPRSSKCCARVTCSRRSAD